MPLRFASLGENPFWSIGANWNRIIGTTLVNDLLIGFNDNSFNGTPIDLNGVGALNNQLGIGGAQPIPGLTEVRMGNDLTNIGTIAIGSNTANGVFQINERLTWVKGRHQLKFGGSWNHYNMERYYSGNNGQLGFIQYNGAFTGVAFADFLLDQVQSKGRGSLTGAVDAPAESGRVLRRRRLQGHQRAHPEPRPALGLHLAARREGRPPGELRPEQRRAAAGRTERQQPRALRAVLQRLGAALRRRLPQGRAVGVPRRLRHHAVHGGHRRQPAPAAEPAVLLRVAEHLRPDQRPEHHRHRLRGPAGARPRRRASSAPGIRTCGRSSRSSGTCSPST